MELPDTLAPGYDVEVDTVDESSWSALLTNFDDATVYQTWAHSASKWGQQRLSHLILKFNDTVVAAVQLTIVRPAGIQYGIANVSWGPLWQRSGNRIDTSIFVQVIRALRLEYAERRKLFLRLSPCDWGDRGLQVASLLPSEGFSLSQTSSPHRTLILDLHKTEDELRAGMRKSWRKKLEKAEAIPYTESLSTSKETFRTMTDMYQDMRQRKNFPDEYNLDEWRSIQDQLPESHKFKVLLLKHEGELVCGGAWSIIGNRGIGFFLSTTLQARQLGTSYYWVWRQIQEVKKQGCDFYDDGGFQGDNAPQIKHFKLHKGNIDVWHPGQFGYCSSTASKWIASTGDHVRKMQKQFIRMRNRFGSKKEK